LRAAVQRWQKQWPDFRFIPALSGGSTDVSSEVFAGRVDDALRDSFADLAEHEVYCCGSPAMVAAVRDAAVRERGLALTHFHADVFVSGPAEALSGHLRIARDGPNA
jgi:CDP-4-dehydro-6-deoxyglucose reductase/terephthalate 1,2-dioxygenase reductase component